MIYCNAGEKYLIWPWFFDQFRDEILLVETNPNSIYDFQ